MAATISNPPNLTQTLLALTVEELKWYAALLPGKAPMRKGELVTMLLQTLTDPVEVRGLWDRLAQVQRQVIAEAVHGHGGRYYAEVVEAKYPGATPPRHPGAAVWQNYSGMFGRPPKREATPYDLLFCSSDGGARLIPADGLADA